MPAAAKNLDFHRSSSFDALWSETNLAYILSDRSRSFYNLCNWNTAPLLDKRKRMTEKWHAHTQKEGTSRPRETASHVGRNMLILVMTGWRKHSTLSRVSAGVSKGKAQSRREKPTLPRAGKPPLMVLHHWFQSNRCTRHLPWLSHERLDWQSQKNEETSNVNMCTL